MQSRYAKLFGEHRTVGRPAGRGNDVVFRTVDKEHQDLALRAKQRAIAVVMEEQREQLRQIFEEEYRWLVERRTRARNMMN